MRKRQGCSCNLTSKCSQIDTQTHTATHTAYTAPHTPPHTPPHTAPYTPPHNQDIIPPSLTILLWWPCCAWLFNTNCLKAPAAHWQSIAFCVIRIDRGPPVKSASFIATEPELEGLKEARRARAGLHTSRIPDEGRNVDPVQRNTKAIQKRQAAHWLYPHRFWGENRETDIKTAHEMDGGKERDNVLRKSFRGWFKRKQGSRRPREEDKGGEMNREPN